MVVFIKDEDFLPDGLTFDDLKEKSDKEKLEELSKKVTGIPDLNDPEVLKRYLEYFKIEMPNKNNVDLGNFETAFEALNIINDEKELDKK